MQRLQTFLNSIKSPYYFGFFPGHKYLTATDLQYLKSLIEPYKNKGTITHNFEISFAKLIGAGQGLSFAAGRMAFYTLIKTLNIGAGDEIILPAFTCSVMANAILRRGAIPVYADIDPQTLGSDASAIQKKISSKTRMVVAQHSFGIPCKIDKIRNLTEDKNIFLLEDCAITIGSSYKGINVGSWGNAAMFSTDHSKPLNTLIGGFLYTENKELFKKIQITSKEIIGLDIKHQKRLFKMLTFERKYLNPSKYSLGLFLNIISKLKEIFIARLLKKRQHTFLEGDYENIAVHNSYPYPAQMPQFLAQLGSWEIAKWQNFKEKRVFLLNSYIKEIKAAGLLKYIPEAYFDEASEIVPLRFIMLVPNSSEWDEKMKKWLNISSTWFRQPVICSNLGPESMGYISGSCPNAERINKEIINWPCVIAPNYEESFLNIFRSIIKKV